MRTLLILAVALACLGCRKESAEDRAAVAEKEKGRQLEEYRARLKEWKSNVNVVVNEKARAVERMRAATDEETRSEAQRDVESLDARLVRIRKRAPSMSEYPLLRPKYRKNRERPPRPCDPNDPLCGY